MENIWDTTCFSQKNSFFNPDSLFEFCWFCAASVSFKIFTYDKNRLKFMVLFQTLIKV